MNRGRETEMEKIILISLLLTLGWASQAAVIPIVSQEITPDAAAINWDRSDQNDGNWGARGPQKHGGLIGSGHGDLNPSPVPEPATMLLFGTGLIGLAFISRKGLK